MFILILIIVAFSAVCHVSAQDSNATQQLSVDDNIQITQSNELSDTLKSDTSEDIIGDSKANATITPLNLEIAYKSGKASVKLTDLNNNPLTNEKIDLKVVGNISSVTSNQTDKNGIATFNFKDITYAELVDGSLSRYPLNIGNYSIKLDLKGGNYVADTVSGTLTVKKSTANIDVKNLNVDFGSNESFTIKLTNSETGMPIANEYLKIKLLNAADDYFLYLTDSEGKVQIKVNQFSPGNYMFNVAVANDDYIQASPKYANVTINELPKKLSISGVSKKFKNSGQIILKVKDKTTGKYVSGVKLQIKVFTGKKYKTFNLVTKKSKKINNAIGVLLKTNKFSTGTHKVTVKITSPKYKGSGSFKLVIPKTAQKYKKFTYVVSNGKGKYV